MLSASFCLCLAHTHTHTHRPSLHTRRTLPWYLSSQCPMSITFATVSLFIVPRTLLAAAKGQKTEPKKLSKAIESARSFTGASRKVMTSSCQSVTVTGSSTTGRSFLQVSKIVSAPPPPTLNTFETSFVGFKQITDLPTNYSYSKHKGCAIRAT